MQMFPLLVVHREIEKECGGASQNNKVKVNIFFSFCNMNVVSWHVVSGAALVNCDLIDIEND